MKPYYEHQGVVIIHGDCREVLPQVQVLFDSCITDPPYHLTSQDKRSPQRKSGVHPNGTGFMGMQWDGGDVAFHSETWRVVLDALKPGAHLLAFGGTRTNHRLACAIEDAGFEIRDMLMFLHGVGFPKSLDISKAIDKQAGHDRETITLGSTRANGMRGGKFIGGDGCPERRVKSAPTSTPAKQWEGYGTALKPAWEPIILGMKSVDGTFAENAVRYGVAGININGCRIASGEDHKAKCESVVGLSSNRNGNCYGEWIGARESSWTPAGRWPANVLLDDHTARLLDESTDKTCYAEHKTMRSAAPNDAVYGLGHTGQPNVSVGYGDSGGASRFFYTAKADADERGTGNNHPTVKPLDLMRYLCKLLCPPTGGILLDPFMGSGSTILAGRRFYQKIVGVELEERYCEIAAKRLSQSIFSFPDEADSAAQVVA